MIPIESFEAQSMSGIFVPIVPGGGNISLTFQNRKEYVEKGFHFRLHELDKQVGICRAFFPSVASCVSFTEIRPCKRIFVV